MRQKPAHAIKEDEFDQKYFKHQREIIIEAYESLRTLRLVFPSHPKIKSANIEIPKWLKNHEIWEM